MSSRSATARMAASDTQPSCCSWTRQRMAITAEACRPAGYFAICCLANARFSSVNAKLAGWTSFGANRRTDISYLSLHTARGFRIQGIDPVLPECACGAENVVADVGRDLDAVEDRQIAHRFQPVGARIEHDQPHRGLFKDVARHRMRAVAAVLLAHDDAVGLEQPGAALDRLDLDALDVELDQVLAAGGDLAVVDQIVERDDRHVLAARRRIAGDAEGLVLGA